MENFIVSARKYRPATFNTVVGQASITTTLKNAIKNNHLAQAFLFCGPRGVGKTTCARILAKTINCFKIASNIEACNECESCLSFNSGHSLNVYELDAASNNSVDDIRNLVDQVRFAPQLGKFKIYIIDEVHMLSTSAFNAFLKTLEEPPAHAIFILATTEKHKIIPTILSRCQIFDFNRIQIEDIADHLAFIAKSENVEAESEALHIIAQKADGALRDACSLFDQIVSFAGNNVSYKSVIDNLNILDYDYYFKITDSILQENIPSGLLIFNEILANGFDGHIFISGLAEHLRNLLVCKDVSTLQLLEVSPNIKERYKQQSTLASQAFLLNGLNITNRTDLQYKGSKNPRLHVELALMQLCSLNRIGNPDEKKNEFTQIIPPANTSKPVAIVNNSIAAPAIAAPAQQIISKPVVKQTEPPKIIEEVHVEKRIIGKTPLGIKKTSISQFINPQKADASELKQIVEEQPTQYFTFSELLKCWAAYAEIQRQMGKHSMFATFTKSEPELKGGNIIELPIDNKVQEEEVNREKPEILSYLRKELQNYGIQLITVYNKGPQEKKFYTSQDKFQRMIEINPNLHKLKQSLDLEIDF